MTEKFCLLVNEIVANIEEQFYTIDVDFDSTNCNELFNDLARLFYEKNILNIYKIEMYKFIRKCMTCMDIDNNNNYTLFLSRINFLLEIEGINLEDLNKIRMNYIINIDKQKLLYAM